jgi:hypothetical protein
MIPAMDFAERAARNEEVFRKVNEGIAAGAEQHSLSGTLPFHCECDRVSCFDTIEMAPGRYEQIVRNRYCFVVIPGHEEPRIERIVETEPDFLVVERLARRARRSIATIHNRITTASTLAWASVPE